MRIKLTLQPVEHETRLPINYQYPLSSAIYRILSSGSPEYARWLHDHGYLTAQRKPLKLFTFSRLDIPKPERFYNLLIINNYKQCTLQVSSPMLEDFIRNFVTGLFQDREIAIGNPQTVARFRVEGVETLPEPEFQSTHRFLSLSPIVVSTMHERNGKVYPYYLRPDDDRLSELIRSNAIKKYGVMYGYPPDDDTLECTIDQDYIKRKGGPEKVSKLIKIKEWSSNERVNIKSFIAPLTLNGNPDLIRCVYECGVGEKNSLGFGMIMKNDKIAE